MTIATSWKRWSFSSAEGLDLLARLQRADATLVLPIGAV
jgi:hypothetical protein